MADHLSFLGRSLHICDEDATSRSRTNYVGEVDSQFPGPSLGRFRDLCILAAARVVFLLTGPCVLHGQPRFEESAEFSVGRGRILAGLL
jgi:hypothetical protein